MANVITSSVLIQGIEAETILNRLDKIDQALLSIQQKEEPQTAELLDVKEVATMLRITTRTLFTWLKNPNNKHIKVYPVGKKLRFNKAEILASFNTLGDPNKPAQPKEPTI